MRIAGCRLLGCSGHDAGRALLAQLYRAETGCDLPPIRTSPGGKPCFEDSPYCFSITHTRRHAFCALSHYSVGIDAEELDRPLRADLPLRILSPRELAQYEASADPAWALLTFWVLKEAAAKRTGEGLRGFPNRTDFSLDDPRVFAQDGCLIAVLTDDPEAQAAIRDFRAGDFSAFDEEENHAF